MIIVNVIHKIFDLYSLLTNGISWNIIINKIKGKTNISGLYFKAEIKSNFNTENPARVIPHPGQGIPQISLIKQLGISNR
jgi:hypothetical protein